MPRVRLGSRPSFASLRPFGLGLPREHHFAAALAAGWGSRHALRYGRDVLRFGACADCCLGSPGWHDEATGGIHLCARRLRGLRRWTAEAFDPARLPDLPALRAMAADRLARLGRVPVPLILRAGASRLVPASWDDATGLVAARLREAKRGWGVLARPSTTSCEGLFVLERLARRLGTPHIDLMEGAGSRAAHTVLQWTTGLDAGTCSLRDLLLADLVLLWGPVLGGHPFLAKLLHVARQRGTRVIAIGPEPEAEGVWLPSGFGSLLLGSRIVDEQVVVHAGADAKLAWALVGALDEAGALDRAWLRDRTEGGLDALGALRAADLPSLAASCGLGAVRVRHLARTMAAARRCVVLAAPPPGPSDWEATFSAIVALALYLGLPGRPGSGLLPLGGEPGRQGGSDLGFVAGASRPGGWDAARQVREAAGGGTDLLWVAGSGLCDWLPSGAEVPDALRPLGLRVHQAHVLDPSVLLEPGEAAVVLPVQSLFEQRGGATSTSIDRIVRFSPEIRGHETGQCRPDWLVAAQVGSLIDRALRGEFDLVDAVAVRERISAEVAAYSPIAGLRAPGDSFQWGGATLHERSFATPSGRARIPPPPSPPAAGAS